MPNGFLVNCTIDSATVPQCLLIINMLQINAAKEKLYMLLIVSLNVHPEYDWRISLHYIAIFSKLKASSPRHGSVHHRRHQAHWLRGGEGRCLDRPSLQEVFFVKRGSFYACLFNRKDSNIYFKGCLILILNPSNIASCLFFVNRNRSQYLFWCLIFWRTIAIIGTKVCLVHRLQAFSVLNMECATGLCFWTKLVWGKCFSCKGKSA